MSKIDFFCCKRKNINKMFCNILIKFKDNKFKDNKFKDKMIKYEFTKRGGQKNERYK